MPIGDRAWPVAPLIAAEQTWPEGRAVPTAMSGGLAAAYSWSQWGGRCLGGRQTRLFTGRYSPSTSGVALDARVQLPPETEELVVGLVLEFHWQGEGDLAERRLTFTPELDGSPLDATEVTLSTERPDYALNQLAECYAASLHGREIRAKASSPGPGPHRIRVSYAAVDSGAYISVMAATLAVEVTP